MGSLANRSCSAIQPSTHPGTGTALMWWRRGIVVCPSARTRSGSAPDPERPEAFSTPGSSSPGACTRAKRSPPIPHMCCVVTVRTALVAMAASTAFPPARSMATPAEDARWSTLQTMPLVA